MNASDDDGLMTQHTLQNVLRMGQTMPNAVKVCGDIILSTS